MIRTIFGGIIIQITNIQGIYYLNKNAHFGNTENFYRHTMSYDQACIWIRPLFRFWKQHRILKASLYLQFIQILSLFCDFILILATIISGMFSDVVEFTVLGLDVAVGILILMCEYIYIGRY